MKREKGKTRHISVNDRKVSGDYLQRQLQTEVQELDRRVAAIQQNNEPNLDQVQHLSKILRSRQSILNSLRSRDSLGA